MRGILTRKPQSSSCTCTFQRKSQIVTYSRDIYVVLLYHQSASRVSTVVAVLLQELIEDHILTALFESSWISSHKLSSPPFHHSIEGQTYTIVCNHLCCIPCDLNITCMLHNPNTRPEGNLIFSCASEGNLQSVQSNAVFWLMYDQCNQIFSWIWVWRYEDVLGTASIFVPPGIL